MSIKARNIKKQMSKEGINNMKDKNYNKAIYLFTKVIEIDSNNWRLFVNRSYCYQKTNNLNEALNDANIAIKLNEKHIAGHYRKGCVLLSLKRYRLAEQTFNDGLKRLPNDEHSIMKLKQNLEQFIRIFGFESEVNLLSQLYDSCSVFTDAFIVGEVMDVINCVSESMVSCESVRDIPDELDLNQSISILSDIDFDSEDDGEHTFNSLVDSDYNISNYSISNGDLIEFRSPDITSENVVETNDNMCGIRLPKSVPIFRKSTKDLTPNQCENIPTVETPEDSSLTNGSIDSSGGSAPKKLVKTRPSFRIAVKQ